jgi:hypothetical protein
VDQTLVKRLFELRFEIREFEREGRQYVAKAHPSPYERPLQDKGSDVLKTSKANSRASRPVVVVRARSIVSEIQAIVAERRLRRIYTSGSKSTPKTTCQ